VTERLDTQTGLSHSADGHGRPARCRRARSCAKPSAHTSLGQPSDRQGNPARCRSAWRRSTSLGSSVDSSRRCIVGADVTALASPASTQTGTAQLFRPHGSPLAWCWAWASALRCAFFRRRSSRSGAQTLQPFTPRRAAHSSCCRVSPPSSADPPNGRLSGASSRFDSVIAAVDRSADLRPVRSGRRNTARTDPSPSVQLGAAKAPCSRQPPTELAVTSTPRPWRPAGCAAPSSGSIASPGGRCCPTPRRPRPRTHRGSSAHGTAAATVPGPAPLGCTP